MSTEKQAPGRLRASVVNGRYDMDRAGMEDLLKRRFFTAPAFAAYGGVAGLYDFGPPGCAVKANIIQAWKNHFVIHDSMSEVDCSALTPKPVLDASGHTAKFSDFMVRDAKTNTCFRADHVLKQHLEQLLESKETPEAQRAQIGLDLARVDDLGQAGLGEMLRKYAVKAPQTGNELTEPAPFNLMFQTCIGPAGDMPGFLRPETAQGIFVNFKRLLEYNAGKLPFAAAQVGSAFRNEIAPRAGLLRVREFPLAEIEYFVNPRHKTHVGYPTVRDIVANLLPADEQEKGASEAVAMKLGDAAERGVIRNEALAYFMGRTLLFLRKLGLPDEHLRFRQHMRSEMAHYAADCWDAEVRTSYGWIECVGHADRTNYDLTQHTRCSAQSMAVHEPFEDGPHIVNKYVATLQKGLVGKEFRKEAQLVFQHVEGLSQEQLAALQQALAAEPHQYSFTAPNGKTFVLRPEMVKVEQREEKETGELFIPHVIEPSFGIGRILYCVLEHAYWCRPESKERGVLSLPPLIAPIKVSVFPLQTDERFAPIVRDISTQLRHHNHAHKVDETGTPIGRRYARTDELGIPFAITVDYDTLEDRTVTLRERDTMQQVRVPLAELMDLLDSLIAQKTTWDDVKAKYPACVVADKE